jgi:minor extracellular serine protease Vpr
MYYTRKVITLSVVLLLACIIVLFPFGAKMQDATNVLLSINKTTDDPIPSSVIPTDINSVSKENNERSSEVIVLLKGDSLSDGVTNRSKLEEGFANFIKEARIAKIYYKERVRFKTLLNGVSIETKRSNMARLLELPSVIAVYPNYPVKLEKNINYNGPNLITALSMTGADIARNELGLTGQGIKVGVIDSGIDYNHPDLGGCFGEGCRVTTGYDFAGNDYDFTSVDPNKRIPKPDADPDDCGGHGSHVAGIIGANGAIKGVAPDVTFGAYKVFGCSGTTGADLIIAAMERAYTDGMKVINISIGTPYTWPEYPTAVAADKLVKKGIVVVASAGNSGDRGAYATGGVGAGERVISVASVDNSHVLLNAFSISPDDKHIGYLPSSGAPPPTSGAISLKKTGTPTSTNDACGPLPSDSLTGHAALIRRGTCSFYVKAINAQTAGAVAVIMYNNAPGFISPNVAPPAGSPPVTIPVVGITAEDGVLISNRLDTTPVTLTWLSELEPFPYPNGGLISPFSSYGMSPDLSLKPDISAPGGFILSTVPLEQGGYNTLSGTSMSSPHVAGAVALLLQAHPGIRAGDVRDVLQNSADPTPWSLSPTLGIADHTHRQGAGIIDIVGAIQATTVITPGKLSLGESEQGPSVRRLTIRNFSQLPVTYSLSHLPAVSSANTFPGPSDGTFNPLSFNGNSASVAFSSESITIPANGMVRVSVTITADPNAPDHSQYGGYIQFTPQGGGAIYRVPYAGFKGDYQSIRVLRPSPNGYPWLAKDTGTSFSNQPNGATYTLQGDDIPYLLVHLNHQSRRLVVKVKNADTGKYVDPIFHTALDEEHVVRNSAPTQLFALPWDGTLLNSILRGNLLEKIPFELPKELLSRPVPNGRYVLELTVLKALGDPRNPAHKEVWVSPVITIARP